MILNVEEYESIQHTCVYEDKDFSVYIEDCSIGWVLHCYVSNWCLSVYKKMLDCMALLLVQAPRQSLYAFSYKKKLTKFAEMFGMESIDTLHTPNKEDGELLCLTL